MSTVKISELTALTSADAADELVIVDDSAGVTKKITHANLANFGTGTVTAGAIDFSGLANAAGMTSEVLDDYEEGTWTASLNGVAGTFTGYYTKVGRLVHVFVYAVNFTATSVHASISGLPFSVDFSYGAVAASSHNNWCNSANGYFGFGGTSITMTGINTFATATANSGAGKYIMVGGAYYTA